MRVSFSPRPKLIGLAADAVEPAEGAMVKYAREPESGAAAQSACPPPHEPHQRRACPPATASPERPAAKEPLLPGASGGAGAGAAWAPGGFAWGKRG